MTEITAALPNELALVAQAKVDAAAFATLYDHYFSRIYNYIRYRIQEADTTDDLTAQVFKRALVNIGSYRPDKAPFSAWLFVIARNAINDHLRPQQRRQWWSLEAVSDWLSGGPQPDETVADVELHDQLLAAVAQLSSRERDLIGLKFAGGFSLPDTFDKRLPINIAGRKWDTDWTERTDTHGFLRGFILIIRDNPFNLCHLCPILLCPAKSVR